MRLIYAHLCDQAFLSVQGKMNIIGIFDSLKSSQYPAIHGKSDLVLALDVTTEDLDQEIFIGFQFINEDGKILLDTTVSPQIPYSKEWHTTVPLILTLQNLALPAPGDYEFHIRSGDQNSAIIATLPLRVWLDSVDPSCV